MSDLTKKETELDCVRRLCEVLGLPATSLESRDRPDVIATVGGRRIGVEVTVFHADEGMSRRGSMLRADEEKRSETAQGGSYVARAIPDSYSGLRARINDKIQRAVGYEQQECDDLWLLIVAQLPKSGALATTFIVPPAVDLDRLNREFHDLLVNSRFDAAYVYLLMNQTVYRWSRSNGWHVAVSHESPSPSRSGLWFKEILNDPSWRHEPNKKAREEAHKAIDELHTRPKQ